MTPEEYKQFIARKKQLRFAVGEQNNETEIYYRLSDLKDNMILANLNRKEDAETDENTTINLSSIVKVQR